MISRRSIRIKVLQALYSQILLDDTDIDRAFQLYQESIGEVLEVNLVYLSYMHTSVGYVLEFAKQQSGKYLINEKDKFVDTQITNGVVYRYLAEKIDFQKQAKKSKTENYIQSEYVRILFQEMILLEEYKAYTLEPTLQNEAKFYQAFCKRILFRNDDIKNYLESYFANIEEDSDLNHFALRRSFKVMQDKGELNISLGYSEMKYLESFANDLIRTTLTHQKEYMDIIEPKLIGWEADRIPILDLLLIKLAISEMLYFESIPLKVTVNEYIDLSKIFCSVKSKDFVNGIMDRIMKELQEAGRITKSGRGLE